MIGILEVGAELVPIARASGPTMRPPTSMKWRPESMTRRRDSRECAITDSLSRPDPTPNLLNHGFTQMNTDDKNAGLKRRMEPAGSEYRSGGESGAM